MLPSSNRSDMGAGCLEEWDIPHPCLSATSLSTHSRWETLLPRQGRVIIAGEGLLFGNNLKIKKRPEKTRPDPTAPFCSWRFLAQFSTGFHPFLCFYALAVYLWHLCSLPLRPGYQVNFGFAQGKGSNQAFPSPRGSGGRTPPLGWGDPEPP